MNKAQRGSSPLVNRFSRQELSSPCLDLPDLDRRFSSISGGLADDPRQPPDLRMMAGLVASGAAMMPSAPASRMRAPAVAAPEAVEIESPPDADLLPE